MSLVLPAKMMGPAAGRIVPFNAALARAIPLCGPRTGPAAPGTRPNSGRPARAQLEQLLEREGSVAWAVDGRYVRLGPAVTSNPEFNGDLLDERQSVMVGNGSHAAAFATVRDSLGGLATAEFLRATPAGKGPTRSMGAS